MCGIVAFFSRQRPLSRDVLERSTKALRHRGPDGQRCWVDEDRKVGLGHARLSIIDLTTGDQPIASEDESLRVVVNGEFYGYEGIQKELEEKGHRLRTRSDSEVALHLYEELGAHCLHRLRGEFAIVLWDHVNRTLFAARDRFGIKPLFYAMHDEVLYLASEVKALFAAGVPARWDCESVYDAGGIGTHQMRTLFEGIYQIPPGHYMLATSKQIKIHQYWDFNYPLAADPLPAKSDAEYAQEFRGCFEEAVRIRLRADVPVGCYLSGGIDSCAILGLAARHHVGKLRAFTLAFDRSEYNEAHVAEEMAAKVQAEFCPVPVRQDDLADYFAEAILQSEILCVNAHGVAKYLLSRAVRDAGYKVVLTGEGSDEILGGYQHFRRDLAGNGFRHAPEQSHEPHAVSRLNGNGKFLDSIQRLIGFVPGWVGTSAVLSARVREILSQDLLETFHGREDYRSFLNDIDVPGQISGREPLHQSLYLWAKTRLPNYLLVLLGDRMEMGHSIEGRVPFLDHHLVQLVRSQPSNQKIRGATHKYILREALRDVVTETVYRRPKHPFLSPPAALHPQGKLSVLLQDTLRGPVLASMSFFDRKKVLKLLDGIKTSDDSARVADDQVLMMVLSASVLHSGFGLSA